MCETESLQERFIDSQGKPVIVDGRQVVQIDRVQLPDMAQVTIQFLGDRAFEGNGAVIAVQKPGKILLSDGGTTSAVKIWDEPGLARTVQHRVMSSGQGLEIYNKYRTHHESDFVTEDSFTGNAGMLVTELSPNKRRYQCSNGSGPFSPDDLVFELSWEGIDPGRKQEHVGM